MNYTENGIKAIQSRDYKKAFSLLEEGYFDKGETKAGCYLAQMYYDERITPRTEEALLEAMLLWEMTKDEVPSSMHKLGVTLFGSKNSQVKSAGLAHITEASKRDYPVSFCVLGVLAYHKKEYARAVECFKRYTGIEKDEKALWMYCDALARPEVNDMPTAIQYLKIYVRKWERADAYYLLGKMMLEDTNESVEDALSMLEKAAQMEHKEAIGLFCVSLYYGVENRLERDIPRSQPYIAKAVANGYPKALKIASEITVFANNEGAVEDYESALQYALRAQELGVDCYGLIGDIYARMERHAEAEPYYKVLYDRGEYSAYASYFLVKFALYNEYNPTLMILWADGPYLDEKYMELVNIAKECYKLCKQQIVKWNPYMAFVVGSYLAWYSEDEKVKAEGADILAMCSDIPSAVYCRIVTNAKLGRIKTDKEAVEQLEKAVGLGSQDAMFAMADIYRDNQMYTKAIELYMQLYSFGYNKVANVISDMYLKGQVTGKRDKKKAQEWAEKANG